MLMRTESALVAVFGSPSDAQAAAKELVTNSFAEDHIHVIAERQPSAAESRPTEQPAGYYEQSVGRWCESIFGPGSKTEQQQYEEAVRRGKTLIGVSTPDQMLDKAVEILNHHSPVETVMAQRPSQKQSAI